MRTLVVLLPVLLSCGCATRSYLGTADSRFVGDLEVRWVANDYFLFLPKQGNPLRLLRPNGQPPIEPGPMYTDGGSIPQALWGVQGLSPWGYAPAYIVHDWLFEARHCGYAPDNQYSFEESVTVIAEGLKAVMENDPRVRNYFVFDAVVGAVGSPVAKKLWDNGKCNAPPDNVRWLSGQEPPGQLMGTISFK
jgi:hypothetical protein